MEAPRILLSEEPSDALDAVLAAGFDAFNGPHVGPQPGTTLRLMVMRAGEAAPCGGLLGQPYAAWLQVRLFWLPEDLRRGGLGARVLRAAEDWAKARGCIGAWLNTFTFQARPFYEKQGYHHFGTLPDCPPGHARLFMMKRFDGETHVHA